MTPADWDGWRTEAAAYADAMTRPPLDRDTLESLQSAGWHVIARAEVSAMKVRLFDLDELLADTVADLEAARAMLAAAETAKASRQLAVVLENLDAFATEVPGHV